MGGELAIARPAEVGGGFRGMVMAIPKWS